MLNQVIVTLWWLGFFTAVGLCLGSFLNVVIYRLPRDKSLRIPLRSVCPECGHHIRWYDNLPIISFLALRGRCRDCEALIATRYVVIEAAMALVVLMLLDAFFIGHVRAGLKASEFGLTDPLAYDWPMVLAHLILFACLLSMSCIDLEHYWVDVRFTNFATIAGFVLHTLWTPRHSAQWHRPADTTAVMSLCVLAGLGITWLILRFLPEAPPDEVDDGQAEPGMPEDHDDIAASCVEPTPVENRSEDTGAEGEVEPAPCEVSLEPSETEQPLRPRRPSRILGWSSGLLLMALFVLLVVEEHADSPVQHTLRAALPLALFFMAIVTESAVRRESDQEIVDAIHEERYGARRMALTELGLLVPPIVLALVGYWIMQADSDVPARISEVLHWDTRVEGVAMLRKWAPLVGLTTAASGYVIAGALGWAVRIVFTLAFGKEAYGTGDIHLMAAAGCVAGWPVALLGFVVAIGLALVGWVLALPFKRSRALPLGPWLALAFLIVALFYDNIIQSQWVAFRLDFLSEFLRHVNS